MQPSNNVVFINFMTLSKIRFYAKKNVFSFLDIFQVLIFFKLVFKVA